MAIQTDRLEKRRVELGIQKSEIARRANLSRATFSVLDNKTEHDFRFSSGIEIAKSLNVSCEFLLGEENEFAEYVYAKAVPYQNKYDIINGFGQRLGRINRTADQENTNAENEVFSGVPIVGDSEKIDSNFNNSLQHFITYNQLVTRENEFKTKIQMQSISLFKAVINKYFSDFKIKNIKMSPNDYLVTFKFLNVGLDQNDFVAFECKKTKLNGRARQGDIILAHLHKKPMVGDDVILLDNKTDSLDNNPSLKIGTISYERSDQKAIEVSNDYGGSEREIFDINHNEHIELLVAGIFSSSLIEKETIRIKHKNT